MNLGNSLLFVIIGIVMIACTTEKKKVVFFGDSITQAGEEDPAGYINVLRDRLDTVRYQLVGAGISGNKVPDLEARVDQDVLSVNPDVVFIYIGINDVWHFHKFNGTTGTEIDRYREGLQNLVDKLQAQNLTVILCTPTVIGEEPAMVGEINEQLDDYAQVVRDVASAKNTGLCDLRSEFKTYLSSNNPVNQYEGILTTDGVHLNPAGNAFLADLMQECLELNE